MIANANTSFAGLETSSITNLPGPTSQTSHSIAGTDVSTVEPIKQTIAAYVSWLAQKSKSERTLEHVKKLLDSIVFDVMSCDVAEDLTLGIAQQFIEYQQDRDYADKTIRTQVAELKRFSKWLVQSGRIKSDPIAKLTFEVDESESVDRAQVRFQRLFAMIEYLSINRFGATTVELNKHCCETSHVCERTTRRDIELLVSIGAFRKEPRTCRLDAIVIRLNPFSRLSQLASK